MALMDEIIKKCPYCGLTGNLKQFLGWQRGDKQGYLGKTPDGFFLLLCPRCEKRIRYHIETNEFYKEGHPKKGSRKDRCLSVIVSLLCLVAAFWVLAEIQGIWKYLVAGLLLAYGGTLIKMVFSKKDFPPATHPPESKSLLQESRKLRKQ